MKDLELEKLMQEAGKEVIIPSDELISKTKNKLHRNYLLDITLVISIIMNTFWIIPIVWLLISPDISFIVKVVIYSVFSLISSSVILFMLFTKEKMEDFKIYFEELLSIN